ncbi:MAG: HAD family phosphatase [Ruminococcaceae bacterium]|nr:HAD family phosphatase [Oscillospiraceae bacterium]
MINKIKGAIFDMDGTLVDSLIFWEYLWDHFGKTFFDGEKFHPTDEEDKAIRTMTIGDAMRYLYSIYRFGESADKLAQLGTDMLGEFYEERAKLKCGVTEFLEHCKNRNIKMCVASASEKEYVKSVLSHLGIDKYFSGFFSCSEIGKGKDEPDVYLLALEHLGTKKEETCIFEDSLTAIKTAKKIGIKTVAIYDKYNYGQEEMKKIADEYVDDGETLLKLLDKGV